MQDDERERWAQLGKIAEFVGAVKDQGLYPEIPVVEGPSTEPVLHEADGDYLLFSSNNVLGMSSHPEVKAAASAALAKYGLGSGGSRLMAANIDVHVALEERIAAFLGRESAICFAAGYMANVGTIPALMKIDFLSQLNLADVASTFAEQRAGWKRAAPWHVLSEEKNHASGVDGIRLAHARTQIYPHKDMAALEAALAGCGDGRKLIVSDGVFSMDGDVAPVADILRLAGTYGAAVMLDDAHGIGVLGEHGRGSLEQAGADPGSVQILMGTFTKAFGGIGGFVAGDSALIDYLRVSARTYIFSAPIPPAIAAGLIKSIDIVEREPWRREAALGNAQRFREAVQAVGLDTLDSETHIVPVVVGHEDHAVAMTRALCDRGIIAPNVRFPAVPPGEARIRFVMTSEHTREQIDRLVTSLDEIRDAL